MIYHIITKERWAEFEYKAAYTSDTLTAEGFIHCSRKEQIAGVLTRFYAEIENLLLMEIDESKLTSPLLYEPATDVVDTFPHIYGPINCGAIVSVVVIQ
ncbi:MAG: DUF952 domain-containing protein [Spirosomataceae bacterium]